MTKIWLISDTHFGHSNIIKYCNRPFADCGEMDAMMMDNWNALVRPQDHVYHLGDVVCGGGQQRLHSIMPRLNGHKRLVLGNHDNHAKMRDYCQYFEKIMLWRIFDDLILTHIPLRRDNFPGRTKVNVHGHIHQNDSPEGPYINVCVERTGYGPIALDYVQEEAKRLFPTIDRV